VYEKLTLLGHLRACATAAKKFTSSIVANLAQSVADALEEIANVKADRIESPVFGNLVSMDENGNLSDSGINIDDIIGVTQKRIFFTSDQWVLSGGLYRLSIESDRYPVGVWRSSDTGYTSVMCDMTYDSATYSITLSSIDAFDGMVIILSGSGEGIVADYIDQVNRISPSVTIGSIEYSFTGYPICTLYHTVGGYGTGGYGENGFGAASLETVRLEWSLGEDGLITIKTIEEYSEYTNISEIDSGVFKFSHTNETIEDSLILVIR